MVQQDFWSLRSGIHFLNHGSFGSCPKPVLQFQSDLRNRLEAQPIQFLVRELEGLWDGARQTLARFVGAEADNLVFVPNATSGVNTVIRSLQFSVGDEVLVTNHEYGASRNAVAHGARQQGAVIREVKIPFPLSGPEAVLEPIMESLNPRTRLVLLDHVTSQSGLIFPLETILAELNGRGIESLIDGAHAPGMIPLQLERLRPTYYTGNCHKWLCAPKGAGFLYVRPEKQEFIRPLAISHGATSNRKDRSRFLVEFGWMGTGDPTAMLSVGKAIEVMGAALPGGWPAVMKHNHELAVKGRTILCKAFGIPAPAPDDMLGSMATVPIADDTEEGQSLSPLYANHLQEKLWRDYQVEVPIVPWPEWPRRQVRISAQLYNTAEQYEYLARLLVQLKAAPKT
ncbi:MAG: aminotransferase class V-fold PLP-dependent enzyme [Verrucomicrobiales bacterium]